MMTGQRAAGRRLGQQRRGERGFSLLELLIAAGIGLVVISGAVVGGIYMQQQALDQQQRMFAQQSVRAAQDLISDELRRAGGGFGNGRVVTGSTRQTAITVVTDDAFASDSTFTPPTGQYASMVSDSLTTLTGTADGTMGTRCCAAGGSGCSGCYIRSGSNACVEGAEADLPGNPVIYANPNTNVYCLHRVSSVSGTTSLATSAGFGLSTVPATDPCGDLASAFWCNSNTTVQRAGGASFRVNWKDGRPRLQMDPDGNNPAQTYQDILWDVEQLSFRFGLENLAVPGTIVWFPEGGTPRLPLDQCPSNPANCPVPGGTNGNDSGLTLLEQLHRRVRLVEVRLVVRSPQVDRKLVAKNGSLFQLDTDGNPRDGYQRRNYTFQVAPRNLRLVGTF